MSVRPHPKDPNKRREAMKKILIFLFMFIAYSGFQQTIVEAQDCRQHIELHSAKSLAGKYGESEMWVLNNIKINLWEKETSDGKGRKVGEMLPGSRALIVDMGHEDYKVKSPFDGSFGWVNRKQVGRTLIQDIKTREPCN